jgi:hypothetical protein
VSFPKAGKVRWHVTNVLGRFHRRPWRCDGLVVSLRRFKPGRNKAMTWAEDRAQRPAARKVFRGAWSGPVFVAHAQAPDDDEDPTITFLWGGRQDRRGERARGPRQGEPPRPVPLPPRKREHGGRTPGPRDSGTEPLNRCARLRPTPYSLAGPTAPPCRTYAFALTPTRECPLPPRSDRPFSTGSVGI